MVRDSNGRGGIIKPQPLLSARSAVPPRASHPAAANLTPKRRRRSRGMWLAQILILLSILGLVGLGSAERLGGERLGGERISAQANNVAGPAMPPAQVNPLATGSLSPLPAPIADVELTQRLTALVNGYPKTVKAHIYTLNVDTGQSVDIAAQQAVPAASVIKLPVLAALWQQKSEQQLALNATRWRYAPIHRASGSGGLQYQPPGKDYAVSYLAQQMIQASDNTASNIIVDNLGGMAALNQRWQQWGLANTRLNNWLPDLTGSNLITCQEMARLLYNLVLPEGWLGLEAKQDMRKILAGTYNKRLMVAGVPVGTPVEHKTGDIGIVLGDVGIVRIGTQEVVVCMMVERPRNHPMGRQLIRDAMRTIYTYTLANQDANQIKAIPEPPAA
jgi:beta-lactamase class A